MRAFLGRYMFGKLTLLGDGRIYAMEDGQSIGFAIRPPAAFDSRVLTFDLGSLPIAASCSNYLESLKVLRLFPIWNPRRLLNECVWFLGGLVVVR